MYCNLFVSYLYYTKIFEMLCANLVSIYFTDNESNWENNEKVRHRKLVCIYSILDSRTDKATTISKIKQDYIESFTCHGLTRICTGRLYERIFWLILLVGCLAFCFYLLYEMIIDYLKYEIRTEIRYLMREELVLPTITVCLSVSIMEICTWLLKSILLIFGQY